MPGQSPSQDSWRPENLVSTASVWQEPKSNNVTQPCVANSLAQIMLLPALQLIGVKGPDADKLSDGVLCKLLRNGRCCSYMNNIVSDEKRCSTAKCKPLQITRKDAKQQSSGTYLTAEVVLNNADLQKWF